MAVVTEEPFRSRAAGSVVPTKWLNVAARWYIDRWHQQNLFNEQLVRQLREYETRLIDPTANGGKHAHNCGAKRLQQAQRRADKLAQRMTELESAELIRKSVENRLFSALPPQRSGIADFSAELLPELAPPVDVTIFHSDAGSNFCLPSQSV